MASAEFCSNPDLSMYKGTIYSSREMLPQQQKNIVQSPLVTVENHSNFTINKTPAVVQLTPKIKLYILLVTCMGFFSMGINSTIVGTTLVHMGLVFNVNTQQMAYTLTAMNLGNVIGSILSGFFFNSFSDLIQFGVLYLVMGVLTVASPWVPSVYLYYVTLGVSFLLQGYIQCGAMAYVVALCPKHKRPALQMVNAIRAFGAFTFPFMAILFLVEIPQICQQNNYISTTNTSLYKNSSLVPYMNNDNYHYHNNSIFNGSEAEIKPCSTDMIGLESVRHPFIIAGSFNISTSVLFFALVLVLKPRFLMKGSRDTAEALPIEDEKQSKNGSKTKKRIKHTKFVLLFLSVVYHVYTAFYLWYEYIFGCFLSTFAIKGLKLPVEQATLLVSLFYGSWAAGRIVASFLSIILSPTKMISINMTFTLIAYTLLLFSGYNDWTVWIGAGTLGFFLASTFPTLMLWVSDFMVLNSAISSVLLTTNALTSAVGSVVVGYLMQHYTYMVLVYINLTFCIVNTCVFIVMVVIGELHNRLKRDVI